MDDQEKGATQAPIPDRKSAAKWLLGKLRQDTPRGQIKGPIRAGPAGVTICRPCGRLFGRGRPVGVPTKRLARHARDHKMGLIRAVKS